jgi:tetrahydromethanopterin S-methyltransferase subunit F
MVRLTFGLATARDGFVAGIVFAIIREPGIIKIEVLQQSVAI